MDCQSTMKTIIIEFVTDLKDNIFTNPADHGELLMVEFFFRRMNPASIMNHVIDNVLPFKNRIHNRDMNFFIQKKMEIFGGLPTERVDYFIDIIRNSENNGGMSDDNRDVLWSYFDTMIDVAETYKKKK